MLTENQDFPAINLQDTSLNSQRLRALQAMRLTPSGKTTIDLRENYGIMSPAPRIMELRRMGYQIDTVYVDRYTPDGVKHRKVALYILRSGGAEQAVN